MSSCFDSNCTACSRLGEFLYELRQQYPDYHNHPVAPFGVASAHLLIVGLAPGMHGANASGRPFIGDQSGVLLYKTLHQFGFASSAESTSPNSEIALIDCRITNAVKCLPPQNKPTTVEIKNCSHFLAAELDALPEGAVVIALGLVAHDAILRALQLPKREYVFSHAAQHGLGRGITLMDSYHCSRYNTQTKRLTPEMFAAVFAQARGILDDHHSE